MKKKEKGRKEESDGINAEMYKESMQFSLFLTLFQSFYPHLQSFVFPFFLSLWASLTPRPFSVGFEELCLLT